jgi:hypothetical protein
VVQHGAELNVPIAQQLATAVYGAEVVVGSARARFKRCWLLGVVALDQLLDPVAGDVVITGDFAFAASLQHHGGDDELRLRHG